MARWQPVYPQHHPGGEVPEHCQPCQSSFPRKPTVQALRQHSQGRQDHRPTSVATQKKPVGLRKSMNVPASLSRPAFDSKQVQAASLRHLQNTNVPTVVADSMATREAALRRNATPRRQKVAKSPEDAPLSKDRASLKLPGSAARQISTQQPERKALAKLELAKKRRQNMHSQTSNTISTPPPDPRPSGIQETVAMPAPMLPYTWRYSSAGGPSYFEVALEAAATELERPILPLSNHSNRESGLPSQLESPQEKPTSKGKTADVVPHICQEQASSVSTRENAQSLQRDDSPVVTRTATHQFRETAEATRSVSPAGDDDRHIDDRAVLRGLHIAISAACDEEVDAWIRKETGVRIRRFLADLKAFEVLADRDRPLEPREDGARARRAHLRKLKTQIRKSRMAMRGEDAAQEG